MGDLRGASSPLVEVVDGEWPELVGTGVDGRPEMSSCTSVTTSPLAVISLLRMIRL